MVFWGAKVKPGKPFVYTPSDAGHQLHLSQATLDYPTKNNERVVLTAKVGDDHAVMICSLTGGSVESCSIDLLFNDDVTFSVKGSTAIHLAGYHIPTNFEEDTDEDYDDDEEDYDSEDGSDVDYALYNMGKDGEDDEDDEDEDFVPNSGVFIEEISDEQFNKRNKNKEKKDKSIVLRASDDSFNVNSNSETQKKQSVTTGEEDNKEDEDEKMGMDEDEDGFIKAPKRAVQDQSSNVQAQKKQAVEDDSGKAVPKKEKVDANTTDVTEEEKVEPKKDDISNTAPSELKKEEEKPDTEELSTQGEKKKKKKKQKKKMDESSTPENKEKTGNMDEKEKLGNIEIKKSELEAQSNLHPTKKTKSGHETSPVVPIQPVTKITESKDLGKKESLDASGSLKKSSPKVKKFPNGLEIHEVSMGNPAGKVAKQGKKVSMIYTGRLVNSGNFFDSNVNGKPFAFRLGVGEVIQGWDIGVQGMRVGDKRKLVIPPALGYGHKGVKGSIPGNATLEFDIELKEVK